MASTLVIYNPAAGRARVHALWPQVERALRESQVDFHAVATRAPLDAMELARAAVGKYDAIVGVGGDGTLHEIINGLLQASGEQETIPVGVIPLGSGDDFAKVLPPEAPVGGNAFDWRAGVQKVAQRNTRLYDAGRVRGDQMHAGSNSESRYFINAIEVGFGAHTVQNLAGVPRFMTGHFAYLAAVFKTMVDYPALHLRIQLDDEPAFEQVTSLIAVTNGRCFGNGFWVCPGALPDDGLFDVMIAEKVSRRTILRVLPKIRAGTHIDELVVKMRRARRVILESDEPILVEADGEMLIPKTRRLELPILPGKVRVIV